MSLKSRQIIPDNFGYYGNWVAMKGFNDNTVIAFAPDIDELQRKVEVLGYKLAGTKEDKLVVVMYCHAPCESQCGYSTLVNQDVVSECNENGKKCSVCKYL